MNSKQRKTLKKIMTTPALASIEFDDIVKCMIAMGYDFKQGEGSRVAFIIDSEVLPIHKPHPNKELKKYAVRQLQLFIKQTEGLL
ncbi:HicA protein [hydrothermal vent metagenome]|uniref:HicA protein n=1 Tax=hydrothermal vent metagenome TaxID=652676 RepID=A0A1W1E3V3_9ZZZZ